MLLSDIDGSHCIDDDYRVVVGSAPFLLLRVGYDAYKPMASFSHPNLLARFYAIHEYKHYHSRRGKFWTARPGTDMYFAVPKDKIELVIEKGYSYVPVKIGGQKFILNVSGGGGVGGWDDMIGNTASTSTNMKKKTIQAIADAAMSIGEAKALGIELVEKEKEDRDYLIELVAARIVAPKLAKGSEVILGSSYSIEGNKGPFKIAFDRLSRKKHVIVDGGMYNGNVRVYYKHINWTKTAKLNGIELPSMVNENRVPATEAAA